MSAIFYGDSWKSADDKSRSAVVRTRRFTRAELQRISNDRYGRRQSTLEEWRAEFYVIGHMRADGSPRGTALHQNFTS